jgi:hypothetical protein
MYQGYIIILHDFERFYLNCVRYLTYYINYSTKPEIYHNHNEAHPFILS